MKHILTIFALLLVFQTCTKKDVDIRENYLGNYSLSGTLEIAIDFKKHASPYTNEIKVSLSNNQLNLHFQDSNSVYEAKIDEDSTFIGDYYNTSFPVNGKDVLFRGSSTGYFFGDKVRIIQAFISSDNAIYAFVSATGKRK